MKGMIRLFPMLATCVVLGACDDKSDPTEVDTRAQVQFVNATGDVTGLNFSANGQASSQNVVFGTPTACQRFNSGSTVFTSTRAGTTTVFGTNLTQNLATSGRYTVVATGTATNPQYLFLNDVTTSPTAGTARIRIVNAVPGTTASDIFVTAPNATLGTATATNIGFNAGTSFVDVPAGQTQIRFRNAGTQTVTYTGTPFNATAGQTTTIIVAPGTTPGTFRTITVQPCT